MWNVVCYNIATQSRETVEVVEDETQAKRKAEHHAHGDTTTDHVYYATEGIERTVTTPIHRTWNVEQRNGYWAVSMYVRDLRGMALRRVGKSLFFSDKYEAAAVSTMIADAYTHGGLDALALELAAQA